VRPPANFGWGRNADGKAREGTIYIDRLGNAEARIPAPEPGFREPLAEFGRDAQLPVAVSGPVRSPHFSRIGFLFGDLLSGALYAITGPPAQTRQDVLEVNLVDAQSQPMNLKACTVAIVIEKAPLGITASSHTLTFNDPVPAIAPIYAGFVSGESADDLDVAPTCTTGYTVGSLIGTYHPVASTPCRGITPSPTLPGSSRPLRRVALSTAS